MAQQMTEYEQLGKIAYDKWCDRVYRMGNGPKWSQLPTRVQMDWCEVARAVMMEREKQIGYRETVNG